MKLEEQSVAGLIRGMTATDPSLQEASVRELYRRGSSLAEEAISRWRRDPAIGALLSRNATVGVAVTRERFVAIRAAAGNPPLADVPLDQDAEEFAWNFDGRVCLDILTTREPGCPGAIARFLEKFGEGIQQVEIHTVDVTRTTELIRARLGIKPIYPAARQGADGTRVNFFLLAAPEGRKVLVELVEAPR